MSYEQIINNTEIKKEALILAIESSCDETAASIVKGGREILSSVIMSSCTEHIKYGGVVPEIASRAHTMAISLTVEKAINDANIKLSDLDAVACTYGAGLLGALLVGVSYAKTLSYCLKIPLIPVSHIRGHLAASYLQNKELKPPFISLLASGGHTAIIEVKDYYNYNVLGQTLDDAVGEAFDKIARVLGLDYPGGPNIEKISTTGNNNIEFPKMLKGKGGYNFSYSGLKTAVINYIHNKEQKGEIINKSDVACSFQCSAVDILVDKSIEAAKKSKLNIITAGGGVIANSYLRRELINKCKLNNIMLYLPPKSLCTDNAAMIAAEGYIQYLNRNFAGLDLNAKANVNLE